ncbi:GNAT family N-acetyltransferase [Ruegeria sp. Ofav3-42]|uniref:GNAT family N-acetyltransferase n=1 Tax=Ruegeria sp. Ofav3-42 TaxID=2917759 RepID=UPI001EF57076|nr:GNAT family N-acetyltransferase [Ruegeria sp. Ofav3-42]MCG7519911.1 GNAT family N-acetyltransferase [Ruegeria sp. Ofav3-42]
MTKPLLPLPASFGEIRRARPADTARICQMVRQLATHHGDTPTLTRDDLARDLFGEKPWVSILVAEMGDKLIGYAAMCGLIKLQFGARGMDVHHLFTEAEFRGRGVGQSLIEACKIEAIARSCRYLAVGTHPDNHEAQAFYTSLGFERRDAHPPRFFTRLAT